MQSFFKRFTLVYVVLGLTLTPLGAYAVGSTNSKVRASAGVKHKASTKKKVSAKAKSAKVSSKKRLSYGKSAKSGYRLISHSRNKIHVRERKAAATIQSLSIMNASGYDGSAPLMLASSKALVINQNTSEVIFAKNTDSPTPIASVTKLMTAMVLLDANLNMDEPVSITDEDVDHLKGTSSRLVLGTQLTRKDLLNLALIASENRAASALASSYPGGRGKFILQMNQKAQALGMVNTHFSDSTGLDSSNVSTAEDLVKMVHAAYQYPEIRNSSTTASYEVYLPNKGYATFNNTNALVRRNGSWQIGLSKTGYISEAGRCLVMQAQLAGQPVIIVLLDSDGKLTRLGDANRVKKWVEYNANPNPPQNSDSDAPMTLGQLSGADLIYATELQSR